jgi:hypothetical protein
MKQIGKLSFTGITPKRLDAIRATAKAEGLALDGQKGLVTWDHGIGVDWSYDENKETLYIQPAIPFGVSANEVEGAISGIVRRTAVDYPIDDGRILTRDERMTRAALGQRPDLRITSLDDTQPYGRSYAKPELAADEAKGPFPVRGERVVDEGTTLDGTHEVVVEKVPVRA